jgi:hypothetical protein
MSERSAAFLNQKIILSFFFQLFCAGVEVLQAGVKGPCIHMPGNWLVRQLNDEPKPVYKVGFIREKGKAIAREVQHSPKSVTRCTGEGWDFLWTL